MSKQSHAVMSPEAKQIINREYHKLQLRWVEEIDRPRDQLGAALSSPLRDGDP